MNQLLNLLNLSGTYLEQPYTNKLEHNLGDSGSDIIRRGSIVLKFGKGVAAKRLRAQAIWHQHVPSSINSKFPRIYSYNWTPNRSCLAMEYKEMETLSDLILNRKISDRDTRKVIYSIFNWINHEMYSVNSNNNSGNSIQILIDQTIGRLIETIKYENLNLIELIESKECSINNQKVLGGFEVLAKLQEILPKFNNILLTEKDYLVHGDLHTGNILCNKESLEFCLIDPRGDFPNGNYLFDICYDSGKLLHDVHAKYSLIRTGQFRMNRIGEREYFFSVNKIEAWGTYESILNIFLKESPNIFDVNNIEYWWAKSLLFEGLLLIGLVPFHIRYSERAITLFISGLVLLNKWIKWANNELTIDQLFEPLDN